MKKTRIAINGFGRIGRLILRSALESKREDLEFVAVNDLMPVDQSALLLEFDSIHKRLSVPVAVDGNVIKVGGHNITVLAEKDPTKLPWEKMGIDIVMECTGIFTGADKARVHLDNGAKRVLVSQPSEGADATIVYGVNHETLTRDHKIISNGSCTTNCLAPVAAVLDEKFGIVNGWMTTVHSYTGDQQLLDKNHRDPRRARAAAMSMIPTGTGAAKAIGQVLPKLDGKLNGIAIRVPTPDVSVIELVANLEKSATAEQVNAAIRAAATKGPLVSVLGYTERQLVSADFTHDSRSSIVDAALTKTVGDKLLHITSWYDNEWGFSNRMCDVANEIGKLL